MILTGQSTLIEQMCKLVLLKHPTVLMEFAVGKCVVYKTASLFSASAIDHCRKQLNCVVQVVIQLTEDPTTWRRWWYLA